MHRYWLATCFCALAISATAAQDVHQAVHVTYVRDNVAASDSAPDAIPGAIKDAIRNETTGAVVAPTLAGNNLPATMTVSTAALLELHRMRKNAVDLCLQLPARYRTRLPECAEIFKHEIRLQSLAAANPRKDTP
jgi:plasmid stabilization system protein ParE